MQKFFWGILENRVSLLFAVSLSLLSVWGCTGKAGPTGPSGSSGTSAPYTYQASFQNGVFPTSGYSGELDTWFLGNSGAIENASPYLEVNTGAAISNYARTIFKFDVTNLPVNAQILSAEVLLKLNPATTVGSNPVTVGLHNLAASTNPGCHWTINSCWIDYNGGSGWNVCTGDASSGQEGYINPTTISTVIFSSAVNGTSAYYKWSVDPAVVQSWITSATNNNGLILKSEGEFGETVSTVDFYPYNDATASNHATLLVTYQ